MSTAEGSITWDSVKDIGHFNNGVMKGTNFNRPRHYAVTYLTLDEPRTAAEHWKVDIKLDLPCFTHRWTFEGFL
jgi:hypothetical protein